MTYNKFAQQSRLTSRLQQSSKVNEEGKGLYIMHTHCAIIMAVKGVVINGDGPGGTGP